MFLSVGADGEPVIVGSSTSKNRYYAIVLRVGPFGTLIPTGGALGKGTVALRPTLTVEGLTIPVQEGTSVANTFVSAADLHLHLSHGIGGCL